MSDFLARAGSDLLSAIMMLSEHPDPLVRENAAKVIGAYEAVVSTGLEVADAGAKVVEKLEVVAQKIEELASKGKGE